MDLANQGPRGMSPSPGKQANPETSLPTLGRDRPPPGCPHWQAGSDRSPSPLQPSHPCSPPPQRQLPESAAKMLPLGQTHIPYLPPAVDPCPTRVLHLRSDTDTSHWHGGAGGRPDSPHSTARTTAGPMASEVQPQPRVDMSAPPLQPGPSAPGPLRRSAALSYL